MATSADRGGVNWGKAAALPYRPNVTVDDRQHGPNWGKRGATMAMIVLSSPTTLTGAEEKKTGPSRFIADFSGGWVDANYANRRELKPASRSMINTMDPIIRKLEVGSYKRLEPPNPPVK